jgi:hypothetical protein
MLKGILRIVTGPRYAVRNQESYFRLADTLPPVATRLENRPAVNCPPMLCPPIPAVPTNYETPPLHEQKCGW